MNCAPEPQDVSAPPAASVGVAGMALCTKTGIRNFDVWRNTFSVGHFTIVQKFPHIHIR
jgi:hypothetical protein